MATASTGAARSIVVFGGTGLLGRRICQAALASGHTVTSVSGSGRPPAVIATQPWVQQVQWAKGDVFKPHTYEHLLKDAHTVVHSIGILLENSNYKSVVRGDTGDGVLGVVSSLFSSSTRSNSNVKDNANPMAKVPPNESHESVDSVESADVVDQTYANYNYKSALILADTLLEVKDPSTTPAFVYVSADRGFPGFLSGYIESKRQAELEISKMQPQLRPLILRPGFMYDPEDNKTFRNTLKGVFGAAANVNKNLLGGTLDFLIKPAVATTQVANACMCKLDDESFKGIVSLEDMLKERS
jgi:NAD(P)-dependent dehydrogenase (short-subunit alcohol dehydrogenase family)